MSRGSVAAASVEREVGRGAIAVVHAVHHPPGPHRDPAEERFDHPTIVFTTVGRWRFESARGRATAGPGAVIVGNAGESYRAGHDDDGAVVTEVAFDSGFGSLGRFHESFRRAYGRSPGAYRRLGPID